MVRDEDGWSPVAAEWAARWGAFADPARAVLLEVTATGPGTRLLDVGCGSGELLRAADDLGAAVAGCDPSPAMLALATAAAPRADLRLAGAEELPWPSGAFDVVTAVNALHLADDESAALAELRRVLAPGGAIALAGWAEASANELDVVERAVAAADGEPLPPDPATRAPGGFEAALRAAGCTGITSGVVEAPWTAEDADALVAGVLLGDDLGVLAELGPVVVDAAQRFRTPDGRYVLHNRLRWAVGRT